MAAVGIGTVLIGAVVAVNVQYNNLLSFYLFCFGLLNFIDRISHLPVAFLTLSCEVMLQPRPLDRRLMGNVVFRQVTELRTLFSCFCFVLWINLLTVVALQSVFNVFFLIWLNAMCVMSRSAQLSRNGVCIQYPEAIINHQTLASSYFCLLVRLHVSCIVYTSYSVYSLYAQVLQICSG